MRKLLAISILIGCALLTGCGFKMRSYHAFPNALRNIYFSPKKPYSPLTVKLKALLLAMRVTLKDKPVNAPFSIIITRDNFSASRSDIINAHLPSSISYTQTAGISIKNNALKKIIASKFFASSESVTLNANQLYMPSTDYEIKNTLNQEIVTQVYYWLTTTNIKMLLHHATNR